MQRYNPKESEPKWQAKWAEDKIYAAKDFDSKTKFVLLTEFPYPSGDGLHMGHTRLYTIGDILARFKRMHGLNLMFPMGYDAFGLPAENYAIKNKVSPKEATDQNISNFEKQFKSMGFSFDWDRAFRTTDPDYYRWTQWLFLRFFKAGLAYQAETAINWCPFCKTGLSNEEVVNGRHERCDTVVEKKMLKQWLLKITDYADKLLEGLKTVDYPSKIADQQINWIGRSEGAVIKFKVEDSEEIIEVFSTAVDTIYGASFIVLAPEHPLLDKLTKPDHKDNVHNVIHQAASRTDLERDEEGKDKNGAFTGSHAINPVNNQKLPIWVADYVLMGYGTGAVMGVPGSDKRDYEFALKYNLPVIIVSSNNKFTDYSMIKKNPAKYTLINSGEYSGQTFKEAKEKILDKLVSDGVAKREVKYKMRDWIFSRQRYWGEPIPIIHCPEDGPVAVPDDQLPLVLPELADYEPTDDGKSPLARASDWVNTTCPKCGKQAKRETDTMPNWAGSSWYYLRYFDPKNDKEFADRKNLDYWGQVDMYIGGMEHTTLHLLYSRFWHHFLFDQKLVPTEEPYKARRGQGIVLAADGSKMSKSKGNVIDPIEIINSGYGADSVRLAIAFLAPYDQTTPWNPEGVAGTYRFLNRVWNLVNEFKENKSSDKPKADERINAAINRAVKKVTDDLGKLNFNTALATQMELVNELYKVKEEDRYSSDAWQDCLIKLVKILAPFAPHLSEELWQILGQSGSVHLSQWPKHDPVYLLNEEVTIVVQVNGKLRGSIKTQAGLTQEEAKDRALSDVNVKKYIEGTPKKVIFVKDKIINFVV